MLINYLIMNLYGLYENYDAIQKAGYVVVFEAEKSVLKRDTFSSNQNEIKTDNLVNS